MTKSSTLIVALAVAALLAGQNARADIVWRANAPEANFVPFGEDGTPGRPVPGDMLGDTITLAGSARNLDRITVVVDLNNATGNPLPATDTWTVDLFYNDGPVDGKSGLQQPGTLIACLSIQVSMPPFSAPAVFNFTGMGVVVPDTFTVVLSSSHPTNTFFQPAGLVGPDSSHLPPNIGSGPNTMWYSSTALGWETNHTWAIADGAGTNYFLMTVEASAGDNGEPPNPAM